MDKPNRKARTAAAAVAVSLFVTGVGVAAVADSHSPRKVTIEISGWPCNEDEVIVGRGDFDGRRWDRYVCRVPNGV